MPVGIWVLGAVALGVALFAVIGFNGLVKQRNRVKEAWSGIDVQLKRRHDLIPNLVEVVEGYAAHEKGLLEEITRLRSKTIDVTGLRDTQAAETDLTGSLESLLVLVEDYPALKADENFRQLHHSLVDIEDHLQMARRYYNGSVRDNNTKVESFPSNLIANLFGFVSEEFFELESATERAAPRMNLDLH